jgi:hypothetical protein
VAAWALPRGLMLSPHWQRPAAGEVLVSRVHPPIAPAVPADAAVVGGPLPEGLGASALGMTAPAREPPPQAPCPPLPSAAGPDPEPPVAAALPNPPRDEASEPPPGVSEGAGIEAEADGMMELSAADDHPPITGLHPSPDEEPTGRDACAPLPSAAGAELESPLDPDLPIPPRDEAREPPPAVSEGADAGDGEDEMVELAVADDHPSAGEGRARS